MISQYHTANLGKAYELRPSDALIALEASVFSALSFSFPNTGRLVLFGHALSRGWLAGTFMALIALAAMILPLIDTRKAPPLVNFVRSFYPQLVSSIFFMEAIFLSSVIFGGYSYDGVFARWDQMIFGFQPSREFSLALSSSRFVNELMFGSYFSYYLVLAITPWLPWIRGDYREAERQIFAFVALSGLLDLWYVIFRVQGPKYWFADLHAQWYEHFEGGIFVRFFQGVFEHATLYGAAFPSSHVAEMTLFSIFAWRIDKRLFALYALITALVSAATVYLYAHYAVDAIAGFLVSIVLTPLCLKAWDPAQRLCDRLAAGETLLGQGGKAERR